jgi:hypothetical protein
MQRDTVASLKALVGHDFDVAAVARDAHRRFTLYQEAIDGISAEQATVLLAITLADPDAAMGTSSALALLDHLAATLPIPETRDWIDRNNVHLSDGESVSRRSREWLVFFDVSAGKRLEASELATHSDWLQRKLSEGATAAEDIELIAVNGRTSRVRRTARRRLGMTRTRPGS